MTSETSVDADGTRVTTIREPAGWAAEFKAGDQAYKDALAAWERREKAEKQRRGLPWWWKLRERATERLWRWGLRLAEMKPLTQAGLAAKAAAAAAAAEGDELPDDWRQKLAISVFRDVVRLAAWPTGVTIDPTMRQDGLLEAEAPAFVMAAREWARSELRLDAAIEARRANPGAPERSIDNLVDAHSTSRARFLDVPARTIDGVLAKALVLVRYIQDDDEPLRDCFTALRGAGRNTEEARFAFAVMQDLGAMLAGRGLSVEVLAGLALIDKGSGREEEARLVAASSTGPTTWAMAAPDPFTG